MVKKLVLRFMSVLAQVIGFLPALIYGYVYSQYFTKATYKRIKDRNDESGVPAKVVLDIGTATGHPLYSIIDSFKDAQVIGIDIDKNYIPACQRLFRDHKNVTIKLLNFYDLENQYPNTSFDTIIFGSSFMLMPDQVKAVEIAKNKLSEKGKIYFLLTLYDQKSGFNKFMELIKPYLKYMTTVDFGKVTYKSEFEQFLKEHNLEAKFKERCSGNFFLKIFKFYIYEATAKN